MTIRTGISDAPTVTLGEGGRQQLLPVLEVFPSSEKRPGKTSIAEMAAFFLSGGGVVVPQIQRLYLNTGAAIVLSENGNQAPGTFSESVSIPVEKEADSLIAGNLNFYTIAGGRIAFSVAGAYRLSGKLYTERTAEGRPASTQTTIEAQNIESQATVRAQTIQSRGVLATTQAEGGGTVEGQEVTVEGTWEGGTFAGSGPVRNEEAEVETEIDSQDIESTGGTESQEVPVTVTVPQQNLSVSGDTNTQNITANGSTRTVTVAGSTVVPRASFMAVVLLGNIGRTQIIYGESQEVLSGSNTQSHLFAQFSAVFRAAIGDEVALGAQVYNNGVTNTQGAPAQWTFLDALSAGRAEVLIERIAE